MNDNKQPESKNGFDVVAVGAALAVAIAILARILWRGVKQVNFNNPNLYLGLLSWIILSCLLVKWNYVHLRLMMNLVGVENLWLWVASQGKIENVISLFIFGLIIGLLVLGLLGDMLYAKYTKAAVLTGLCNGSGQTPKAVRISKKAYQTVITFLSPGMSPDMWEQKKSLLEYNLDSEVQKIKSSSKRSCVNVVLNNFKLPLKIRYQDFEYEFSSKTHTYPVGKSTTGIIESALSTCPHILIGGTTGMGKSTSFKLILYSLLKNTPEDQIEFKLLDLKKGIEVSDFKGFKNVDISRDEFEALKTLELVCKEMNRRYKILESKGEKLLDPVKSKLPRIVVAVDEASVIFGKTRSNSNIAKTVKKARERCEEIAKLGRAAGIHLILATQRATSASIDTSTLDNLDGRLCFRTQSVSGSTAILGDKSGTEIPDVPGRAIWRKGTKTEMVQVPFMTDLEFSKRCQTLLSERYKGYSDSNEGSEIDEQNHTIKLRDVSKI